MLRRGLRAHAGQAAILATLGFLLAAVATAAPAYARAAAGRLLVAHVSAAGPLERTLSLRGEVVFDAAGDRGKVDAARAAAERAAAGSGLAVYTTLQVPARIKAASGALAAPVVSRDGACEHLTIAGSCPAALGEVLLSTTAADKLGVRAGDELTADVPTLSAVLGYRLTVVGVYQPGGDRAYWAGRSDLTADPRRTDTPVLAGADTVRAIATADAALLRTPVAADAVNGVSVTVVVDTTVTDPAALPADLTAARSTLDELRQTPPDSFFATGLLPELFDQITAGRRALAAGVLAAAGALLLVGAFVLLLAAAAAADRRAPQTALGVLRGAPVRTRFLFAVGPSAFAVLAGAVLGAATGLLSGGSPVSTTDGAAAGAVLVAVLALVAATETRVLRTPVLDAVRRAQRAAKRLRFAPLEALVVVVALLLAYQNVTASPDAGLAPLAPMVSVLAAALLAGRIVAWGLAHLGVGRLRRGDLGLGLAAMHLARRPHTARALALVAVAVATPALAASGVQTTSAALRERAVAELGAARVITVVGSDHTAVRAAVHAADPDGRWLLAAARQQLAASSVVAVESDRLARVSETGAALARRIAADVRPAVNAPVQVTGTRLVLDVTATSADAGGTIRATLVTAAGQRFTVPITVAHQLGAGSYAADVPQCADGCRLAWLGFTSSPEALRLTAIRQQSPDTTLVDAAGMAAAGRWRPGFTTTAGDLTVLHGDGWLSAQYRPSDPMHVSTDLRVLVADAPVPLPAVVAGRARLAQTDEVRELPVLDGISRPVRVVDGAGILPGAGGDGFLIDHEYADRLADEGGVVQAEVWARADTPAAVLTGIRERLLIAGEETVDERVDRMVRTGPGQAARFRLGAALLGVLLGAAGLAVITTGEYAQRRAELLDLRRQGLTARTAVRAIGWSAWLLLATGVLLGAALAIAAAIGWGGGGLSVFTDDWTATGVPTVSGPAVGLGVLVAAAPIAASGWLSARRLARAVVAPESDGGGSFAADAGGASAQGGGGSFASDGDASTTAGGGSFAPDGGGASAPGGGGSFAADGGGASIPDGSGDGGDRALVSDGEEGR
ncbi:hypothetical protein HDA40_000873 [Hamadaea flava]|uniref:FtsX-like permease family protein n=2 Tax=Hamadaea flava TaxID=1742688 RepID=A0ABV8LRP6_9ACTN|nr:hypothetical protein [Hamadaea flava]